MTNFEDLEIWKLARYLTGQIYQLTRNGNFVKDYSLCNQIQRASVSVMSNIAEGYERGGNQEFIQYLAIAKGSCGEMSSSGTQSRRSVLPFSFSTSITGVIGGLTKRKTTMDRRTRAATKSTRRAKRLSQGCLGCRLVRFLVRSPDTA